MRAFLATVALSMVATALMSTQVGAEEGAVAPASVHPVRIYVRGNAARRLDPREFSDEKRHKDAVDEVAELLPPAGAVAEYRHPNIENGGRRNTMRWWPRAGRIVLLAILGAILCAASAHGKSAGEKLASVDPYWLGPSFAGLPLGAEAHRTVPEFDYGDFTCEGADDPTCWWSATIATDPTCAVNPIAYETPGSPVSLLRGGGLMTENPETKTVYVGTGYRTFFVRTEQPELMSPALAEARRHSQPAPEPLPPPVYPMPVLRELKRVTAAAEGLHRVKAIAQETELRPDQVRYRMRVAELLGPQALAHVPVPTMSTARVERLKQLATLFSLYPTRTAEKNDMTVAELRKLVSRVHGLSGGC